MNTANNKRRKESQHKMEKVFIELIQTKEVNEITVTDICQKAHVNRSTFYANYLDISDMVDKIKEKMFQDFHELYDEELSGNYNSNDYLKLFYHIQDNQLFYKTCFKLHFDLEFEVTKYDTILAEKYYNNQNIDYHIQFFRGGITTIIKMWLKRDCDLSPEEMFQIVKDEYKNKH